METWMKGVTVTPLRRISTGKGDVFHAMKVTDDGFCGFGEVYFSEVYSEQRKGWKRHNRMALNLVVVRGAIRFIIYDDREDSPTKGMFKTIVLSSDGLSADDLRNSDICGAGLDAHGDGVYARLTVAPGLWMAFEGVAEGASLLMDLIPEPHDPSESDRKELYEIQY